MTGRGRLGASIGGPRQQLQQTPGGAGVQHAQAGHTFGPAFTYKFYFINKQFIFKNKSLIRNLFFWDKFSARIFPCPLLRGGTDIICPLFSSFGP